MEKNILEIDLGALRHNYRVLKEMAGPHAEILGVVKAGAYGHGLIPVARTLAQCGAKALAVFDVEEGAALRQAGLTLPIIALSGILPQEAAEAADLDLTVVVWDALTASCLSQAFARRGQVGNVMVKVDTGMGRLGLPPGELAGFLGEISALEGVRVQGIVSHLAASEHPENPHTQRQSALFRKAAASLEPPLPVCHLANSGAILAGLGTDYAMVRPGIALYGSSPEPGMAGADRLRPVMAFKSRVLQVKTVPAGTPISYGMTFVTRRESVVATIPVGYDDGYFRSLSNKGIALVHGTRVPVAGTVCMNLTMLDVTDVDGVGPGDEVVLLGGQGGQRITAEEIAVLAGTISYEVYCALGRANPKVHRDGGQ